MNVTPDPGSLYFSATEAVVLPANEVRITNIFDEDNKPTIDNSKITIPSLQAGEFFEKDIEYITSVINDVEKQFSERTLN